MFAFQSYIVHTAFGEVTIDFKCANTGVFGFATGVNAFLFVHCHHLMASIIEGVVISAAFTTIQCQYGC